MARYNINRRQFLATSAAAAGAAVFGAGSARGDGAAEAGPVNVVGMTPSARSGETVARLPVKDAGEIKVLQFTDLHFFCKPMLPRLDVLTADNMARYVDMVAPDLLLISGDSWHDNPDNRGEEFMHFAVEKIQSLGVPWLFTWGNHDQVDDYAKAHDFLTDAPHSLYRGGPSSGNYTVELTHDGKPVWEFLCMNSSDRGLMDGQREWLRGFIAARGDAPRPPAFAVVHIPVKQYANAWEEAQAEGVKLEDVSYWDEDGTSFALIQEAIDFRAYFCGHDHVNNYRGRYGGAELVFGQSTGHGGYGANLLPKGATLITINAEEKGYSLANIFPDGEKWAPEPGLQIDDVYDVPWDVPGNRRRERDEA